MKKLLIVVLMLSGITAFAQKEKDKVVTSQTKKTTVMKDGKAINQKVKVVTEKTQDVEFDKSQKIN